MCLYRHELLFYKKKRASRPLKLYFQIILIALLPEFRRNHERTEKKEFFWPYHKLANLTNQKHETPESMLLINNFCLFLAFAGSHRVKRKNMNSVLNRQNYAQGIQVGWDKNDLEIKTRNVEETLQPLINQVYYHAVLPVFLFCLLLMSVFVGLPRSRHLPRATCHSARRAGRSGHTYSYKSSSRPRISFSSKATT